MSPLSTQNAEWLTNNLNSVYHHVTRRQGLLLIVYIVSFNNFSSDFKALFASCIPEIIDLIGTRPKYGGTFKNERGRRQDSGRCASPPHFDFSAEP